MKEDVTCIDDSVCTRGAYFRRVDIPTLLSWSELPGRHQHPEHASPVSTQGCADDLHPNHLRSASRTPHRGSNALAPVPSAPTHSGATQAANGSTAVVSQRSTARQDRSCRVGTCTTTGFCKCTSGLPLCRQHCPFGTRCRGARQHREFVVNPLPIPRGPCPVGDCNTSGDDACSSGLTLCGLHCQKRSSQGHRCLVPSHRLLPSQELELPAVTTNASPSGPGSLPTAPHDIASHPTQG